MKKVINIVFLGLVIGVGSASITSVKAIGLFDAINIIIGGKEQIFEPRALQCQTLVGGVTFEGHEVVCASGKRTCTPSKCRPETPLH
ncbi:MAG: hypothetical protein GXO49_06540 [Chlorobi bacterium]|nr:hypothetical protein [Chlorobiota bacterium]